MTHWQVKVLSMLNGAYLLTRCMTTSSRQRCPQHTLSVENVGHGLLSSPSFAYIDGVIYKGIHAGGDETRKYECFWDDEQSNKLRPLGSMMKV